MSQTLPLRVANFVAPLNQFSEGFQDECVAYGIADIYYSSPVGVAPRATALDIQKLADLWYAKETGSDASTAGLSLSQAEAILSGLGQTYKTLALDINIVKQTIEGNHVPVLITAPESTFYDTGLNRVPYRWNYNLYNHSIVAYGIAPSGDILVRDYANTEAEPGSERIYSASRIKLISAIAITPRWKHAQPPFIFSQEEIDEWIQNDKNMPQGTGMMLSWCKARRLNHFFGPPQDREVRGTFQGKPAILQEYAYALGVDIAGVHTFFDGRGFIGTF